jgi:hypothetical protein
MDKILFSKSALGPSQLLFRGDRGSFSGGKRPRREDDNSHPSGEDRKNAWSDTSTPPIHLHDMDRGYAHFLLYFELRLALLHGKKAVTDQ